MSAISRACIKILESLSSGLTTAPPFGTVVFHLAKNSIEWSQDTPAAAITECDFDGYAPVAGAYGPPQLDLQGDSVISPTVVPAFGCDGTLTPNAAQSVYVTGPGTAASAWMAGTTIPAVSPTPGMTFTVTPKVGLNGGVDVCVC